MSENDFFEAPFVVVCPPNLNGFMGSSSNVMSISAGPKIIARKKILPGMILGVHGTIALASGALTRPPVFHLQGQPGKQGAALMEFCLQSE